MKVTFYNATIVLCDRIAKKSGFIVENGKFLEIGEHIDGGGVNVHGAYIIPGLVDTHIHGLGKHDFEDENCDFITATSELKSKGTTSFFATVSPFDKTGNLRKSWPEIISKGCKGYHAEGPFLNPNKQGGFFEKQIQPYSNELMLKTINSFNNQLKIMTVAPELVTLSELASLTERYNIKFSAGHTDCDYETAIKAFNSNIHQLTHTYNAMRTPNHRQPGILEASMLEPSVFCELIYDLYHVSPASAKILIDLKTPSKIIAVSDCVPLSPDCYIKDGLVYHKETICGSQSCMFDLFRNLVYKLGLSISEAVLMTSTNPATKNNIKVGKIKEGYDADFLILDSELNLESVFTAEDLE